MVRQAPAGGLSPSCLGSCQPAGSPTKVGPTSFRGKRGRICWPSLCVHPQELPSPLPPRKNQWHLHPHTRKPKQPPLAPDLVLKALILVQEQSKPHTQLTLMHVHTHKLSRMHQQTPHGPSVMQTPMGLSLGLNSAYTKCGLL